ncbi:MAG: transglutaminase family protein [Planctomycetota bacterium]
MQYAIRHETEYRYAQPVTLEHVSAHLRPRAVAFQTCQNFALDITPTPMQLREYCDYFGNPCTHFMIEGPHERLLVSATCRVHVRDRDKPTEGGCSAWESLRDALRADVSQAGLEAFQYTFDSPLASGSHELRSYVSKSFKPGRPVFDAAQDLNRRIHQDFTFDPVATDVTTPVSKVFAERRGVCQDFAHLMIACLRTIGLPARYVSGYLRTEPPPGKPRLIGADASHAWVSVYGAAAGGSGWLDLDPTNDCVVGSDHVTVAWGRDFADVTPVKGVILGGGEHTVQARVDIVPEGEATPLDT